MREEELSVKKISEVRMKRMSYLQNMTAMEQSLARVAISDRKNRQNRIGVGKFSDRPEFGRQSRQILSEKSGNRKNRGIGKIGRSAKSADRQKSAKTPEGFTWKIRALKETR